jgi:hypothetical protein
MIFFIDAMQAENRFDDINLGALYSGNQMKKAFLTLAQATHLEYPSEYIKYSQ